MEQIGNPISYYTGFISSSRNVLLSSSVAVGMFGYSNAFKISFSTMVVRFASTFIFLFSFLYGIITITGMKRYIKLCEKVKDDLPEGIQLDLWKHHVNLLGFYIFMLFVMSIIGARRFFYYIK